jgi:hypothetical protein
MSEEYDYYTFSERFPGAYALGIGVVIGALAAVAVSSAIALSQFAADMPWKELLGSWGKMIVLTIPTFAAVFGVGFLAHHYRRAMPPPLSAFHLPADSIPAIQTDAPSIATHPPNYSLPAGMSLVETVVHNAKRQAAWHYVYDVATTRRDFEQAGVTQTIWNSGRHILTAAEIVTGNKWAEASWDRVEAALDRIHIDEDKIWVPLLGKRSMVCLHIDGQAVGKRYTNEKPPHPTGG